MAPGWPRLRVSSQRGSVVRRRDLRSASIRHAGAPIIVWRCQRVPPRPWGRVGRLQGGTRMAATSAPLVLHPDQIERFDRGNGVQTIPLVGKWNAEDNVVTTGMTIFAPGTGIPLHTHNVEETV